MKAREWFPGRIHSNSKYGTRDQEGDERPIRFSISYCDDNDGYHGAKNLKMLKEEIKKQVRMTGYFSIVTRLGRIG